ncbi:hypothetical protein ABW19_dt0203053 [Dactylella cylindrospora]|nr:hypothetical protein ABW19_dt0203053 [Dactylella cylindrospora]
MASKTIVVITGANTGIGFEAVKAMLGSSNIPYHIFVGARSLEKLDAAVKTLGDTGIHTLTQFQVDISSDESIQSAFGDVKSQVDHIDVLVNNAGSATQGISTQTARQAFLQDYDVNVAGTYVMTDIFLPLLLKSSAPRLIFLTSGLSTLTEASDTNDFRYKVPPAGWPKPPGVNFITYRSSKVALNMVMVDFARVLKNDGVKVWCISPGFLATNLGGNQELLKKLGAGDPEVGGVFIKDVIEGARDGDVGKVIQRAVVQPW